MKKMLLYVVVLVLLTAGMAVAAEDSWLEIGGDYRLKYDYLKGDVPAYTSTIPMLIGGAPQPVPAHTVKNNSLFTNRFGLNVKATPVEDVSVKARFVMYKVWGHNTATPIQSAGGTEMYFADRAFGAFDGVLGHVPSGDTVYIDYAYATLSNIAGAPLWFSAGRRPSTGGIPSNLRQNTEKVGTAGIPAIMVDYAFDGATIGFAPDIEKLPGAYAKLCYGKGFDGGFRTTGGLKDTDFMGLNVVPYDTNNLHIEVQYQRGFHIFDKPSDGVMFASPNTPLPGFTPVFLPVNANVGNIDWAGAVVSGKVAQLNWFVSAGSSMTDTNGVMTTDTGMGMLCDMTHPCEDQTGYAVYVGGRYDIKGTGTKIGAEYNHGSKYWIAMAPAADDIWTSKLGTRGDVYEVYIIQELSRKALSKRGKVFFRLGYQYYDFEFTGSNNWMGFPVKVDAAGMQMFAPVKTAKDLYATFEVQF